MPEIVDSAPTVFPAIGSADDVFRSLRRYVALLLGSPPWTVRLQRTRVDDDARPVAILERGQLTTPQSRAGMRSGAQGDQQKMQTFTVVCYPDIPNTAARSAEYAREIADRLDAGFSRGLVTDDTPPVNIGAPWRVPVYSYEGVPIDGPGRAGGSVAYMHANVDETFNVREIQDPLDELRYTVVANLRVTWWAAGRAAEAAPVAVSMPGVWEP